MLIAAALGVVAGACGKKAERPATQPERGLATRPASSPEPTPSAAEPEARGEPADDRAPAPRVASGPPIPPIRGEKDLPPRSKLALGRTLISGTGCGKPSRLPRFGFDEAHDRAWVVGEDEARFSWHLPMTWKARLERRDLLKIWGPPSRGGVFSVIELFVAPRCEGYDNQPVYERLAARALIGLNRQAETVAQVRQRDWQGRVGGPDFATEIVLAVAIETPEGTKELSLYVTKVGESKTFAVFAAGACSFDEPAGSIPVMCKSQYSSLARLIK